MRNRLIDAVNRRLTEWWPVKSRHCRRQSPVVSFTFDDFAKSAWLTGGAILEQAGVRGTFFVSAAFSPERRQVKAAFGQLEGVRYFDPEDVISAHEHGHEIGCHTFDHVPVPMQSDDRLLESIRLNAEFVYGLLGAMQLHSFAFPLGAADIRTKKLFARRFSTCRGTTPGVNRGQIDLAMLRAVVVDDRFDPGAQLPLLINEAKRCNGWLIFCCHDITSRPSRWGCTPTVFESIVKQIVQSGIEIAPMKAITFPESDPH